MSGVKFNDYSVDVKGAIDDAGIAFLHEAVAEVQSATKSNTKVRTGQTKGSWQTDVDEAGGVGVIGSDYMNAIYEEFGTGEYALMGNGRKGGWIYRDEKGKYHFTKGKRPRRPFFRAWQSLQVKLIKRAEEIFGGLK